MLNGEHHPAGGIALAELADRPLWVAWQTEDRPDVKGNLKPTKVPYSWDGSKALANKPATWCPRRAAEASAITLRRPYNEGGIGLEFTALGDGQSLAGVDLDTCRARDGTVEPWAWEVIRRLASYAEVSPSKAGVKVFFIYPTDALPVLRKHMGTAEWGKQWKRPGGGEHPPAIELYLGNRYFAVTDQHLEGTPAKLMPVSAETLLWLIQTAGPAFARDGKPAREGTNGSGSDASRSAEALRIGAASRRAGASYAEMCRAIETDPKTADWYAEKGQANGGRELHRIWNKAAPEAAPADLRGFDLTEDGVALAFAARHAGQLRYCHDTGGWHEWTGTVWQHDRTRKAFAWTRKISRDLVGTAADQTKSRIGRAAFAAGVERFAQADPPFAVTSDVWDRDPFLLGTPGGTVELRTGELRAARQADLITKQTAVAPAKAPDCPQWLAFLDQATADDPELIGFLRQWCGYCLTGDTREHALLFGFGPGGNGKSVFINTVAGIMGSYALMAGMETFTAAQHERHTTELARLRGARMVTASETEEGRAWAETRIKQLTGGDPITARFMRQDDFTFKPQFKLTIVGNNKPVLKNVDEAARRRFNIVPFLHKPPKPDKQLEAKLQAEWPAILRWMVEGCLDWQRNGLTQPKAVKAATDEYFEAQDYFTRWLNECCDLIPTMSTRPSHLLHSFQQWCQANGEPASDNRKLRGMIERTPGLRYGTTHGTPWVRGIGIRPDTRSHGGGGGEGFSV